LRTVKEERDLWHYVRHTALSATGRSPSSVGGTRKLMTGRAMRNANRPWATSPAGDQTAPRKPKKDPGTPLEVLLREIENCRICATHLPEGVRPVLQVRGTARLCIASQAPGIRAHETGLPFNDRSGDRLRDWMGVDREVFYDERRVAIIPMAFCFPGHTANGGDKPPRRECAAYWHKQLFAQLPEFKLILLVGSYAQAWHLGDRTKESMTETIKAWRDYAPRYIPLPHPSWRNNAWLRENPWFEQDVLPYLRRRVRDTAGIA
jgi:uracil-DNA glycosylase